MAGNKVLIRFLADTEGINKGVQQVNGQLESFGNSAKKLFAGFAAGFTANAILDIGKSAVLAASDFNEMASKVDQVFGQTSESVKTWADDAAVNFGLTKTAALDAASTFGVLGDKAGLTGKDLSDFSTGLGSLAADMASFSNTSVDDAIAAIGSGLRGEAEPLRAFGVLLDDATLKQEAMKLGIYQGNGALTSQQKILAAQAAIYDQTSKAQGDFARTSGGIANQMRIVQAEVGNLSISLGQGLLEGFGGTADAGKSLIDALQALEPAVKWTGEAIGGLLAPIGPTIEGIGSLITTVDLLTQKLGGIPVSASDAAYALNPLYWGARAVGSAFEHLQPTIDRLNEDLNGHQKAQKELADEFSRSALMADAYAGKLSSTSKATRDEAYATKSAADAQKELNAAFADAQAARSYVLALDAARDANASFAKAVKDAGTSLDGSTEKGRKNRDAIVSAFADNEKAALAWQEQFGKTTEETVAKADELNVKTVRALKKAGYKKADVEEFLGANGLWTDGMTTIAKDLGYKGVTKFTKVGKDLGQGLVDGLRGQINAAYSVGGQIANAAEQGARDASETHSPSKKWYLIGLDLTEGLKEGLVEGQKIVDRIVTDSYDGLILKMKSRVVEVPKALTDAYSTHLQDLQKVIDEQGSIIQQGLDSIKSMSDGFVSQVLGNVSLQTKDAQGNDLTPEQIVALYGFDIEKQRQAVAAIAQNIGTTLPPALLSQVLAMPPDSAIALANFLGANPAMLQQLATNYESLAKQTETTLGIPMGLAWAQVGDQSALKAIEAAKKRIAKESDDFKKWVTSKLDTTVTVKVRYVAENNPSDVMNQINTWESNNGPWRT